MYEEDNEYYRKQPEEYKCDDCGEHFPTAMVNKNTDDNSIACDWCLEHYPEELVLRYHHI